MKRLTLALFLCALPALPNACATTAAGNWSAAGTWTSCGSTIPGNGDTATIDHAVTVDVDTTVGTSPSNSTTIVVVINAAVTVAAAKTWTVRGNVTWNSSVILQAGANWTFDPTQASTRGSAIYKVGPNDYGKPSKLDGTACTLGSPCTVKTLRTNGDEGRAYFTLNGFIFNENQFDTRYVNFTDLGGASNVFAIDSYLHDFNGAKTVDIRYSTFLRCGAVHIGASDGEDVVRLVGNTFTSSLDTWNFSAATDYDISTGTRLIDGNYFDKQLGGADPYGVVGRGYTITNNVMAGGIRGLSSYWASFTSNVLFSSVADPYAIGNISNSVVVNDQSDNPHFLFSAPGVGTTLTYDGLVIQYAGAGSDGDGINVACSTCTGIAIQNTLVLRSGTSADHASGTLASFGSATANGPISVYHNTMAGGNPAGSNGFDHGIFFNECVGACTPASSIANYKSNLQWFDAVPTINNPITGAGANHFIYQGTPNNNVLANGTATNNTCWNCVAATVSGPAIGTMYNVPLAVGQTVPGTNDLDVAPGFADPTRTVEKWAAFKGQAATLAGAKTQLATNPTTMVADLLNYLRAGYAPMNVRLATAAHDASYIGAVKPILMFGVLNQ